MIKTNRGMTEAVGSISELLADISCIVEGVYERALRPDLGEKAAKGMLQEAFDRAIASVDKEANKTEEADKPEGTEDKVDRIEGLLHSLVSEIINAMEGDDE